MEIETHTLKELSEMSEEELKEVHLFIYTPKKSGGTHFGSSVEEWIIEK